MKGEGHMKRCDKHNVPLTRKYVKVPNGELNSISPWEEKPVDFCKKCVADKAHTKRQHFVSVKW